jgi:hypothetical protein
LDDRDQTESVITIDRNAQLAGGRADCAARRIGNRGIQRILQPTHLYKTTLILSYKTGKVPKGHIYKTTSLQSYKGRGASRDKITKRQFNRIRCSQLYKMLLGDQHKATLAQRYRWPLYQ